MLSSKNTPNPVTVRITSTGIRRDHITCIHLKSKRGQVLGSNLTHARIATTRHSQLKLFESSPHIPCNENAAFYSLLFARTEEQYIGDKNGKDTKNPRVRKSSECFQNKHACCVSTAVITEVHKAKSPLYSKDFFTTYLVSYLRCFAIFVFFPFAPEWPSKVNRQLLRVVQKSATTRHAAALMTNSSTSFASQFCAKKLWITALCLSVLIHFVSFTYFRLEPRPCVCESETTAQAAKIIKRATEVETVLTAATSPAESTAPEAISERLPTPTLECPPPPPVPTQAPCLAPEPCVCPVVPAPQPTIEPDAEESPQNEEFAKNQLYQCNSLLKKQTESEISRKLRKVPCACAVAFVSHFSHHLGARCS